MTLKTVSKNQTIASKTYLVFTAITNIIGIICILAAANYKLDALRHQAAYQRIRSDIEALYRTVGRGVDAAYVCKFRAIERSEE